LTEYVSLAPGEKVVGVVTCNSAAGSLTVGTASGVVKRVLPDYPAKAEWEVIGLKDGDQVVGCGQSPDDAWLVFITSDAQLLRFEAGVVRPQGRPAGGMAGIKLAAHQRVVFFGVVESAELAEAQVVSVAGSASLLEGLEPGAGKVTPLELYPTKGRATGGVRCQRFLKGQDQLIAAWAGPAPARAVAAGGQAVALPPLDMRRDASGVPLPGPIAAIG